MPVAPEQKRRRRVRLVLIPLMILIAWILVPYALADGVSETQVEKSPWTTALSVEHYDGFEEESEAFSQLTGDLSYRLNPKHSFRLVQILTKTYTVTEVDAQEFKLQDTLLYHYWKIRSNESQTRSLSWRTSAILPLSERSQTNDLITRFGGRFSLTGKFFKKRLTVSYRPGLTWSFHKFKQTPGGTPLTRLTLSHSLLFSHSPLPRLTLAGIIGASLSIKEESRFQEDSSPTDGGYSLDLYGSYDLIPTRLSSRVGFTQSDSQIKAGRTEISFFDSRTSAYYLALDYIF